jgi:hypothetical protein
VLRKRAWAGAAWLATALFSVQASAASLVEVRVGNHADFTRIVLETDAPVRYELSRATPGEVRVRLFATASPRKLGSKSKLLKEVVVESDSSGSVARLALKQQATVDVKEMVLTSPPRIVLDLLPKKGGAAAVEAKAAAPAPVAATPTAPAPAPIAAEEKPAADEAAPPAPAPEEAKLDPAPAPAEEDLPARDYASEAKAARDAGNAAKEAAAQAELDRLAGVPPSPALDPAAARRPEPAPAAAPVAAPGGGPDAPAADAPDEGNAEAEGAAAAAAESEGYEAAEDEPPSQVTSTGARARVPAPGALAFLPSPLDDPLVLGVVGSLLALVAVLTVLRGRSARAGEQESLASPFSSAEGYSLPPAEGGVSAATLAPEADMGPLFASAAAREHEVDDGSMFDVGEDEAMREEAKPEPAPYVAMSSAAAPASSPSYNASDLEGLDMRVIEELERRLAHLETRLEEVVDAKERLERHVAAQTEELRVQRAAIARTQRVLRGVVKSDDLPTEPAPKV